MGTRNLTCVVIEGKYVIAQYAQWDGYPGGQGTTILNFLRDEEKVAGLKANLKKVRFLDHDGIDKELMESYNKNAPTWSSDPDNRTPEQIHWFKSYISRDIGGEILQRVCASKDEEIILINTIDFAGDSLMCEWAYVVDFDKGTFEVYKGFNKTPPDDGERFKTSKREGEEYYPVSFVTEFSLDALPSETTFLSNFKDDDEKA